MAKKLDLTLKIWRQKQGQSGGFKTYQVKDIDENASFLEMLDIVNEQLTLNGEDPIEFEHDCREGICGCCGAVVNGKTHGSHERTTLCQLHVRKFTNNEQIVIEPFRAKPFKVIKDLMVDRSGLDAIISEGGYVSTKTGQAPEASSTPIKKEHAELAMDAAQCIGCGACVASCPNAAAMLFTGAKVSQYALLPQGNVERKERVLAMVNKMDELGFGNCSNERECEVACPKGISADNIFRMNREFIKATLS